MSGLGAAVERVLQQSDGWRLIWGAYDGIAFGWIGTVGLSTWRRTMAGYVYAPDAELDSAEIEAIAGVARDLWEAWYIGDADLMRRCFHPDSDNRGLVRKIIDTRTELIATDILTRTELVEMTGAGVGLAEPEERDVEVTVLAASHHLASVKTAEKSQSHLFHLMRFPEGWRIVQSIWTHDGGVIPIQTVDI